VTALLKDKIDPNILSQGIISAIKEHGVECKLDEFDIYRYFGYKMTRQTSSVAAVGGMKRKSSGGSGQSNKKKRRSSPPPPQTPQPSTSSAVIRSPSPALSSVSSSVASELVEELVDKQVPFYGEYTAEDANDTIKMIEKSQEIERNINSELEGTYLLTKRTPPPPPPPPPTDLSSITNIISNISEEFSKDKSKLLFQIDELLKKMQRDLKRISNKKSVLETNLDNIDKQLEEFKGMLEGYESRTRELCFKQ